MSIDVPIAELVRVLRAGPPLRLAVLFGSAARGTWHAGSDLDVGIVPVDPELSLADEVALQRHLEQASGREVDLVRLDRAATFLLGQIARDGQLLFESAPGEFVRFRAQALVEWLDFAPAFERAASTFRRRLAEISQQSR